MNESAKELKLDETEVEQAAAAVLFASMKMMVSRGVPPAKALRACAVEILQGAYGSQVWEELEVPKRTIERWRAELRQSLALAPEIEDEPPAAVIEAFQRLTQKKGDV